VSSLPAWFANVNLVIIALIFIVGMGRSVLAFWLMLGVSFLMEIYSFMPFGIIILSMTVAYAIAYALLTYYFADRTLYSFLAITMISVFLYELFLLFFNYLINFLSRNGIEMSVDRWFWLSKFQGLAVDLILVLMIYHVINYLSRNLKPVFLIRKKYYGS
jgi:hypothetical protein